MEKQHEDEYVLVNANEEIVRQLTTEHIAQADMCHCEKCYLDVCALTLNNIKSNYVTSRKGQVINNAIKAVAESRVEVLVAISKAIELVKSSPMHPVNESNEPKKPKKN